MAWARGVVRSGLHGRGCGQHLMLRGAVRRHQIDDFGLAHRQGAGLVEDDDVQLGGVLERRRILEQDAIHGAQSGPDHDGHRSRQAQRVWTGDDKDGDGQADGEQEGLADDPEPDHEGQQAYEDRGPDKPLGRAVGQQLRGSLGVLGLLNQFDDLGECCVRTDFGGAVLERAALVDRRADHGVAHLFLDRHRLAGQHGFIDERRPLQHGAIDRYLVAGPDHDRIAGHHLRGGHLHFLAVTQNGRLGRGQIHQGPNGFGCAGPGAHLKPVTEKDEDQQNRRRFVELLSAVDKGGADAEEITGANAQNYEHRHVGDRRFAMTARRQRRRARPDRGWRRSQG